uniref:Carboxyl transferase n=2 Tax=Streptomyces ambofaciens (strain ATCC 23877 / 3486 / DSM 40053 / JCM 4204 / NBRC 12836 / NRRL B-2516) TaxID=278992 RepID=UPI0009468D13|nr:Chain A, Carboxyl transferase [Streptomyces ambofaciens ATCC 23877]5INF_B Chain B, Carboxyl transferase [Streptomyces ambofaciens ATCC 23877]5INF_C Chain C, Carboxyl transferase [Streptomyces ambofaciens ATCC 23877]5INF_D Chain D, Carboxyl transferase [Streptomyces ambofaciens ATCC 23877]5INF_E Chain E, Carboxyl transferase [Streptomyces ambofaciens ATCC 23877]5INF_F Chain F, Carboxyl transferase [Streptomyces ambofaciens ATCC 23877]5INI_A Chain A, Putative carboxyl transferase [Streptomyc
GIDPFTMSLQEPVSPVEESPTSTADRIADLAARHEEAVVLAEKKAADRQHLKGKLTARARIDLLLDPGSFVELDEFVRHRTVEAGIPRPYGDGVVTGHGTIDGRQVCVFSHDFTTLGGSMGEAFGSKVVKIYDFAMSVGCPVIGINDSGGARIQEGVMSIAYYTELGVRNVHSSGVIPQISLIMGPCAGGSVYSPALTDFTVMVKDISYMFVTGPEVVSAVMGEQVTAEQLGGPAVHAEVSGNAHYVGDDEQDAISWVQTLLGYLPPNNLDPAPVYDHDCAPGITEADLALDTVIPDSEQQVYDMADVITAVLDDGDYLEIHPDFARNIICALGRVEGHSVAVVANQPRHLAGVLDIDASEKAARFIRFCDSFNIPVLTFMDVPGYLPGVGQEHQGIIRRGIKLFYAYAESTVPKITVITRKAYGGGYAVMGSRQIGADRVMAWPTAEIAVMGANSAVPILHRRELAAVPPEERAAVKENLVDDYRRRFGNPYEAAAHGYVDMVISPSRTRYEVARALASLRNKRQARPARKHGNIPL